jgi:hypothetical protein
MRPTPFLHAVGLKMVSRSSFGALVAMLVVSSSAFGLSAASALIVQPEKKDAASAPTTQPSTPSAAKPADDKAKTDKKDDIVTAQNNALPDEITPELDEAIAKGMKSLATEQNEDGSFGGGRYNKNVAVTALSCLALMADGNLPSRGTYKKNVEKGLEFVLSSSTETGLLAADTTNGPMYGHGFATLFLGEVYGMTSGGGETALSSRIHDALVKAVNLIVQTQNEDGGWRYNPVPFDADVSVTICQVMALRSARNAGIEVPKETIDRAVDYVKKCQNTDGGFKYQLQTGMSLWPRTAAGVAAIFYSGIYKDEAIDNGLKYLLENAMPGETRAAAAHYFYGHYYSVQAMYLAGGEYWAKWWPAVRKELISKQTADGSWPDPSVGPSYGTAMALIVLQMPKRFLPIFQK